MSEGHDSGARQAIDGLTRELRNLSSHLNEVKGVVNNHSKHIAEIEGEMERTSDSVDRMSDRVSEGLEIVASTTVAGLTQVQQTTADGLLQVQQASEMGFKQLDLATQTGFTDTVSRLGAVDASVQRMTQGMIQMQLIAVASEAQKPLNIIRRFSTEITERFAKALEKIVAIRGSYDSVFNTTLRSYEDKLRHIGAHIYEIYDNDFQALIETELTDHLTTHWLVPRHTAIAQVGARDAQLDNDLAAIKEQQLLPLVGAEKALDAEIRNHFAVSLKAPGVEVVYVPALVVMKTAADIKTYCGNPVEIDREAAGGPTPQLDEQRSWSKVCSGIDRRIQDGSLIIKDQPLRNLGELKKRLDAMVTRGDLSADRRQALEKYLDAHGMSFLTGGAAQQPSQAG